MSAVYLTPGPAESAACGSTFFDDDVQATVKQIKATRGILYALFLNNQSASARAFLQIFFKPAASVLLGVTKPDLVIRLPAVAGGGGTEGEEREIYFPIPIGLPGTGLSVAGTTTWNGAGGSALSVAAIYR